MSDIVEKFSIRLGKALAIRNMKPVELHEKTGLSESLISKYLSDTAVPRQNKINYIATVLDVSPVWLLGYDIPMERVPFDESSKKRKKSFNKNKRLFPILGTVKAGYDYLAQENWIGYINLDKEVSDPENYFALQISGNSMEPVLYEDDIVLVHQQNDVENGQVGIVLINNEEATVKKIIKYEDYIELIAFNSYYPPKRLTKKDNFKIIGKVTEARISKIFE